MGFLDDAIREHLELKRRRGGDPAEIERAEREALGPVRRHPEPLEGEAYHDEAPNGEPSHGYPVDHEADLPAADHDEIGHVDEPPAEHEFYEPAPPVEPYVAPPPPDLAISEPPFEDPYETEPAGPREPITEPEAIHGAEAIPDAGLGPEPSEPATEPEHPAPYPAASVPPEEHHPHLSQPTQEYEVEFDEEPPHEQEPAPEGEGQGEGEDMLEETPEFLQDTPDHDRLWFEQKPPRDFDFDR